ncbi:endonuclease/exonuclease/phosphatase family protein, partial [Candidatus Sumerlaeota bacterium]
VRNNRRALWCAAQLGGHRVLLASLHNDTFVGPNNLAQTKQLLEFAASGDCLLVGDFNAKPDSASIVLLRDSGKFSGEFDGPPTFPAPEPTRTIDYILAPPAWQLLEHRVIHDDASDHCPVLTVFRLPE